MMSTKGAVESALEGKIRRQIERRAKRYEILLNGAWITPRTAVLNADAKFLYCNVDGVAMKMPPHLWRRSISSTSIPTSRSTQMGEIIRKRANTSIRRYLKILDCPDPLTCDVCYVDVTTGKEVMRYDGCDPANIREDYGAKSDLECFASKGLDINERVDESKVVDPSKYQDRYALPSESDYDYGYDFC